MKLESMSLRYDGEKVFVLDQTRLPQEKVWIDATEPEKMVEMIRGLKVRGAPLIGVASVINLANLAKHGADEETVRTAAEHLRRSRPTAVNLMNNLDRLMKFAHGSMNADLLMNEAAAIFREDQELCAQIARNGASYVLKTTRRSSEVASDLRILTHCNTGGLATAGVGTAIGVIQELQKRTGQIHVFVDETRPLLQGGRLTAWEMTELQIPHTLICDSMAAILMREQRVDCVIVGCDRIARNGDFANKVGTYGLAVLARHHRVPFYVAGPYTTVDLSCESAAEIPIEERAAEEVRGARGAFGVVEWAPSQSPAFNPAFDVTPAGLVSAWILDCGVYTSAADMIKDIER